MSATSQNSPANCKTGHPSSNEKARSGAFAQVLRFVSAAALLLAFSTSIIIVVLHVIHCFQAGFLPWTLKSAYPLILIGVAFACLQFTLPRTRTQIVLGLAVALAFILWGTEQFLSDLSIISFIDDIVVFLFVLDLSIVIYGHLKPNVDSLQIPFDESDAQKE